MSIKFCSKAYFSGVRFFNEPEISDSGPPALSPSRRTCAQDFYILKNPSTSAGFEPASLGSRGKHGTPRPLRPYNLYIGMQYNLTIPKRCKTYTTRRYQQPDLEKLQLLLIRKFFKLFLKSFYRILIFFFVSAHKTSYFAFYPFR